MLWQPDTLRAHAVAGVPFAGFRIDVTGRRYWLRHMRDGSPRQRIDAGDVTAVYRFSKNIGLAFTARDGRIPPLFKVQRTMDTGIALVF
jgi:hypothetical protein